MKKLFKGGCIIYGDHRENSDILVEDGKILKVEADIKDEEAKVINVEGRFLFPGFIDPHTHFDLEVCNTVTADDFYSGTKAAIAGGTTTIIDFATQERGEDLLFAVEHWNQKSQGKSSCDYGYHMAISEWNEVISRQMEEMTQKGITSYKIYMTYDNMILDDEHIYDALSRIKEVGGIAGVHCENSGLIKALVEKEKGKGVFSPAGHPASRPVEAEAEAINRLLEIAAVVDVPVVVVHLSTKRGFEVIENARSRGQKVYVETCPQYLLLNEDKYHLPGFESGKYVCAPPLRKKENSEALWEALVNNQIMTIATDHCSFTLQQKEAGKDDFTKIPGGMPGIETRPTLIYTFGVEQGLLTIEQMCEYLSENVAKLYDMYPRKGTLLPGSDADIVVWNPQESRTLSVTNQVSRSDYCPFEGTKVQGIAEQVYLRGTLVAEGGKVICEKQGEFVSRTKGEYR